MSNTPRLILGILVFTFFLGVMLAMITNTTYNLLSPITLTIVSLPLLAVITASNTPVVKGAAMASLFLVMATFFIFSGLPLEIFGIIIVPIIITMGLGFAEIGQG